MKQLIAMLPVVHVLAVCVLASTAPQVSSFSIDQHGRPTACSTRRRQSSLPMPLSKESEDRIDVSSYATSETSAKGIVTSLTGIVNFFMRTDIIDRQASDGEETKEELLPPPSTPAELMEKIREDYTERNYLWTGDIYTPAFEPGCKFEDPTLSFEGRDTFVQNVKNLKPLVDALIEEGGSQSKLMDISLNEEEGFVQTRWNMIGSLTGLPWKPKIDVIGNTKFWYRPDRNNSDSLGVYYYDEQWEMPASSALLQLVTKAGTIQSGAD